MKLYFFPLFLLMLAFSPKVRAQDCPQDQLQSIIDQTALQGTVIPALEVASRLLLEKDYGDGPLGEGPDAEYDQDPLARLDKFDCTTYVETVLALARSRSVEDFHHELRLIRYRDGEISFITRNHFTDADWVPENIKNGALLDVTKDIMGADVAAAQALIDKPSWYAMMKEDRIQIPGLSPEERTKMLERLRREGDGMKAEPITLPYAPLSKLYPDGKPNEALFAKIPAGAVINIVRPNWELKHLIGTNMNVSHQGIVIRKPDGELYLRHASSKDKKVVEVKLHSYLEKFLQSATIKGINILVPQEP